MAFPNLDALLNRMRALGAQRLYAKPLAENDNSKQQVYFGGSFEILKQVPFTTIREEPGGKRPNFKAGLNFWWIDDLGHEEQASGAQLILYPDYPEVRLSGFLRGCSIAPSTNMQPVPAVQRKHNNGPDGRVLFLGITETGKILSYLAVDGSSVSQEFKAQQATLAQVGVFWEVPLAAKIDTRIQLISDLRAIHNAGWHLGKRLNAKGVQIPYKARNGGGYTLEALLGIIPNGISEPDYLGWEIKAFSGDRITLMTPEPDLGYYGSKGVEAFVRQYGKPKKTGGDILYFTGTHKVGQKCHSTNLTMKLDGFDAAQGKIAKVSGGIFLEDPTGILSAGWSFKRLIEHWGRKHAAAAYVPYASSLANGHPQYQYSSPIYLGEETTFERYLVAMNSGKVIYDPGSKVEDASTKHSRVKARSQFRISRKQLPCLYAKFNPVNL